MTEILPDQIDDDRALPVKGSLLRSMISAINFNRWTTGWGLLAEKSGTGGVISLDPNVLPATPRQRYARITGFDPDTNMCTGEEIIPSRNSDSILYSTTGAKFDGEGGLPKLQALNGIPVHPGDIIVPVYNRYGTVIENGSVTQVALFEHPIKPFMPFPVALTEDGSGSAGSSTTQCSFTYTVKDDQGTELATEIDPTDAPSKWVRPTVGLMTAATYGMAMYRSRFPTEAIQLSILYCNEYQDQEAC